MNEIFKNLSVESMIGEIWKPIPNYAGYEVSNKGRVRSFRRWRWKILKPAQNNRGYLYVSLTNESGTKCLKIHRLVGLVYKINPDNLKEINHIDSDKRNNIEGNVEWVSRSYNMRHMIESTGAGHRNGISNPKATIVVHKELGIFCTMREAAFMSGLKEANFNNMMYEIGYRINKTKFIFT